MYGCMGFVRAFLCDILGKLVGRRRRRWQWRQWHQQHRCSASNETSIKGDDKRNELKSMSRNTEQKIKTNTRSFVLCKCFSCSVSLVARREKRASNILSSSTPIYTCINSTQSNTQSTTTQKSTQWTSNERTNQPTRMDRGKHAM